MQHIYQKLYHKIDEFQSHSYSHGYDEEAFLSLLFRVCLDLSLRVLDAIVGGEVKRYIVMKRMRKQGKINLVVLQCIAGLKYDLSLYSEE